VEENEVHRTRHPEDPRPLYNLGTLRQQREEYAEAARLLQDAAGTAEGTLAQRSFYNLGADLFRAGLLREARAAFLEAIRRDPGDEDAKYNLELTQKRLDEMSARQDSSGAAGDSAGGSPSSPQPQPSPGQDGAQPSPGRDPQANRPPGEDRQQPQAGEPEGSQGREGDAPPPSGEGRESERQDSSTGPDRGPRADGALATESLQMAQILRGLENQERELLMQRFRARSRNLRVEKDW
jgi:Ca-activated chloride channel family protein